MDGLWKERAASAGVSIVHVDQHLVVIDKPSGLLSVPGRGPEKADCAVARTQAVFADALVVHRLDQPTSGLFLLARGIEMQQRLSLAFETRRVGKRYVAVVDGEPAAGERDADGWSTIDLPIGPDWWNRPKQVVDPVEGRPSVTRWRVLAREADATRLELEPLTGRSHQLRVHLQALGHPILGDALYASEAIEARAPRLLLHATELSFEHPATGAPVRFESPPPF